MTANERAARIAAWAWAASLLGVEAGPDRIMGLVEVTSSVPLPRLKPALERVIKSEPQGFMPSPGAVIAAASRLAELEHAGQPRALSAGREMGREGHRRWMGENNPEGWDDATWKAFIERMSTDPRYEKQVKKARDERNEWAANEVIREIGGRQVSSEFRTDTRRRLNTEALDRFPRPHPTADGWVPSKQFDPIAGLTRRVQA